MKIFQRIFYWIKEAIAFYGTALSFVLGLLLGLLGLACAMGSLIALLSTLGLIQAQSTLPMWISTWLLISLAVIFSCGARACFTTVPDSIHRLKESLVFLRK